MSASLFGGAQGDSSAGEDTPYLLTFKAGKMNQEGNTITADESKGLVYLVREDEMLYFLWQNRKTGVEDEPIILFPDDVVFRKCKSCPNGRVYYLKFANNRRQFFWMQEPDEKKDEMICKKLNNLIDGGNGMDLDESQDNNDNPGYLPSEMAQMTPGFAQSLGLGLPAQTPAATATPVIAPNAPVANRDMPAAAAAGLVPETPSVAQGATIDPSVFRGIMAGLAAQIPAVQQGQQGTAADATDLSDILTSQNIEPLLQSEDIVERLRPFLPEGSNLTAADVAANVRSPQYAQALSSFSHALRTGQLDQVMAQFGVDPAAAAAGGGGIAGLCKAIQDKANQEKK